MDPETEFRRLYQAHRSAVHAYFTGRTGDRDLAADLMQETFTRVWRHLDRLAGMGADGERAWIFTIARNLSVDHARQARTRSAALRSLASQPARAPRLPSTQVIESDRVAAVGKAISELPEAQRVTLTMAAAGQMTSAEIGAALGVPAGTVRYRLSQARTTLAAALGRYDEQDQ